MISEPLVILNTNIAVYIGIVYSYLPFMVLPIFASFEKMDASLVEAAVDLGCTTIKAFWVITVPIAFPGILAGALLVFIPAVGEFVIPDLLGGSETLMIGRTLWVEFFNNRDWPLASAVAIVLLLILVLPIMYFQRAQGVVRQGSDRRDEARLHAGHRHRPDLRLRLPLSADPAAGDLLVQRLPAGHGVGRLLAQVVRRAAAQRGAAGRPPG